MEEKEARLAEKSNSTQESDLAEKSTPAEKSAPAKKPTTSKIPIIGQEDKFSRIFGIQTLTGLVAVVVLVWLIYVFASGDMYRFYASALFLFYALTKRMWVSVMMLGVFQTMILVPLRIIRLQRQDNIKEFQKKVEQLPTGPLRQKKVKDSYKMGNRTFLFYVVDFMIQLLTFLTIGRLFLTDFYANKIDPTRLYHFVPYPQYPIMDTWFKIPYVVVTKTISLGWKAVLIGWAVVIGLYLLIQIARRISQAVATRRAKKAARENSQPAGEEELQKEVDQKTKLVTRYTGGSVLLIMLAVWLLLTHLPTAFAFKIFTGDVGVPNRTLNTITAFSTFGILLYFAIPQIVRKGKLALKAGIPKEIVDKTQRSMLRETFSTATFVGLGAFFITNQIPSAFELSIFTLEVISLLSPLTLDRLILKSKQLELANQPPKIDEGEQVPVEFRQQNSI